MMILKMMYMLMILKIMFMMMILKRSTLGSAEESEDDCENTADRPGP